jgi:hypothetical protein
LRSRIQKISEDGTLRHCSGCDRFLSFDKFAKDRNRKSGLTSKCKECRNKVNSEYWKANPEFRKKVNDRHKEYRKTYYQSHERKLRYRSNELAKKFGITHEAYQLMLNSQNGVCAICGQFRTSKDKTHMVVDHDHKTGEIRGILCNWCNNMLGYAQDSTTSLRNAITYLERKRS